MTLTLSKTETTILLDAAGRDDAAITLPERLKPVTRERLLGKLFAQKLIRDGQDGESAHCLTAAGFRAVGLRPPRRKLGGQSQPRGAKQALVLDLLRREEGASLTELAAATGWLPHTTRAALSRLRSSGTALTRSPGADGGSTYRVGSAGAA